MGAQYPRDLGLAAARALVQRAVDKAEQLGLRGAVAVVGATGTLITASRTDAGGPGGMARARSKAWISATQQIPSSEHLHRFLSDGAYRRLAQVRAERDPDGRFASYLTCDPGGLNGHG